MGYKILIIEDELTIAQTIQFNLELEDYQAQICVDGSLAINIVKSFHPDLILLDVMLPHKDGITIMGELRKEHIETPIIFLTAKGNSNDKIKGLKLGAEDYITKPFELEELLLRIKNVLKRMPIKSKSLMCLDLVIVKLIFLLSL